MLRTSARPYVQGERRRTKGDEVIRWIEAHCVMTTGAWIKKRAKLLGWQKRFIRHLFEIDSSTGYRRYRWALLGMPKKNGKTELAAWLALYFLIGDGEPGAWVACAASADKQADLVFGAAKRCVTWSPTLSQICEVFDSEIIVPSLPGAKLVRVAASAGTNDGPSWHAIICDEFHEWTLRKATDTHAILTNGVGARTQPIILQITTAGFDLESSLCGEHYQLGRVLEQTPELDPGYLFWWYEADLSRAGECRHCGGDPDAEHDGCWQDVEVWRDANPSWGATLPDPVRYLRDQLGKKTESVFKRYFLNLWVLAEDVWLPDGAWAQCEIEPHEFDVGLPLYVGIDGGLKRDSFAVVAGQRLEIAGEDRLLSKAWVWENPYPKGHPSRDSWKLNLREPAALLREFRDTFKEPALAGIEGPAFAYDPRFLEYMAQDLTDEGLNMIEFPQTDARMSPASELLYTLILGRVLAHEPDETFSRHVHASVQRQKDRGWRLARPAGNRKANDAGIGLAMMSAVAYSPKEEVAEQPDIY